MLGSSLEIVNERGGSNGARSSGGIKKAKRKFVMVNGKLVPQENVPVDPYQLMKFVLLVSLLVLLVAVGLQQITAD